ncbi:MAG: SPOR domain-containing protein [Alphaproteobacteria bacterium]|nr:SPOR domain-containing protein [Alphaproteobacteria bacterium]
MKELRSAFRPPKPISLKVRLRKMLHPPYIPFTAVLLAALSFTLVLSYAENWGRSQSRTIHSQQAPGTADRNGVTGKSVAHQNGVTPRIRSAVFKKDETLYHVLTGPFPSRSLAEKTCAEFEAAKQDCLVVKR